MDRGLRHWLLPYIMDCCLPADRADSIVPIDIVLCRVDHYEPSSGGVGIEKARERVSAWIRHYSVLAARHKDSSGISLQHTWFYPPHHPQEFLKDLVELGKAGLGEVEMHLHHNHMQPFPDTDETLRAKILKCIADYSRYGIFCLPNGEKAFSFIHGDWSLANARGASWCGVNNEIKILKECGCYADFTFPSLGEAQPSIVNRMYYTSAKLNEPKSYNRGKEIACGTNPAAEEFMMIQGIIGMRWHNAKGNLKPCVDYSNLDGNDIPFQGRVDFWVKKGITIKGCPNWRFVKLHTHSAKESAHDAVIGSRADAMFHYLESKYNDGKKYRLHYVTARQMYNMVKAAEAGKKGNPREYEDFAIPPYVYYRDSSGRTA